MKKILFVFPQWHFNINDTLDELKKTYELTTLNYMSADEVQDVGKIGIPGVKKINLKLFKILKIMKSDFFFPHLVDLWKKLDKKYDYVVFKNIYCPTTLFGFFFCKLKGIKIVFSEQKITSVNKWHLRLLLFFVRNIYLKRIIRIRNIKAYSPTSVGFNQLKKYVNQRFYVPFAIKPKSRKRKFSQGKEITLLNISKFQERKDQKLFLRALEEIQLENPGININAVFVGGISKNKSYYEELNDMARKSKINIKIIKKVKKDKISKIFLGSDLFVLSSYDEPAAYSILEAMAYGLPVICSDENGTKNYIEKNTNGFVFKARSLNSLKHQIKKLIIQNGKINWNRIIDFGHNSIGIVQKKHSPEIIASHLKKVFGD